MKKIIAVVGALLIAGAAVGGYFWWRTTQSPSMVNATDTSHAKLITNEFAYFNPGNPSDVISSNWEMTSGSVYAVNDYFWTGKPDSCAPNADSTNCTNSNVFRLNSKQNYGPNVRVNVVVDQAQDITNTNCSSNDTCWHGVHIWLGYQNEYNLYYASINRADGNVVIKRKVPCGNDNSGTYFVLSSFVKHPTTPYRWHNYTASAKTNADGSVTINIYDIDQSVTQPIVTGTDRGGTNPNWSPSCSTPGHYSSADYPPLNKGGAIGIRGDFDNFFFTEPKVTTF